MRGLRPARSFGLRVRQVLGFACGVVVRGGAVVCGAAVSLCCGVCCGVCVCVCVCSCVGARLCPCPCLCACACSCVGACPCPCPCLCARVCVRCLWCSPLPLACKSTPSRPKPAGPSAPQRQPNRVVDRSAADRPGMPPRCAGGLEQAQDGSHTYPAPLLLRRQERRSARRSGTRRATGR